MSSAFCLKNKTQIPVPRNLRLNYRNMEHFWKSAKRFSDKKRNKKKTLERRAIKGNRTHALTFYFNASFQPNNRIHFCLMML